MFRLLESHPQGCHTTALFIYKLRPYVEAETYVEVFKRFKET
jgi:hypothetical protein